MPRSLTPGSTDVVAIVTMNRPVITAPKRKKPDDGMPSFSSKPATSSAASARDSSSGKERMSKRRPPSHSVAAVATST